MREREKISAFFNSLAIYRKDVLFPVFRKVGYCSVGNCYSRRVEHLSVNCTGIQKLSLIIDIKHRSSVLLRFIREGPGLKLDKETDYSEIFLGFPHLLHTATGVLSN
jgi:hypothetical protein